MPRTVITKMELATSPAAAAPPWRLEQVGLPQSSLESAPASRARVTTAIAVNAPMMMMTSASLAPGRAQRATGVIDNDRRNSAALTVASPPRVPYGDLLSIRFGQPRCYLAMTVSGQTLPRHLAAAAAAVPLKRPRQSSAIGAVEGQQLRSANLRVGTAILSDRSGSFSIRNPERTRYNSRDYGTYGE